MKKLLAAALALLAAPVHAETPDAVARRYGLAGEVLVARGDKVLLDRGYGTIRPDGGAAHKAGERWRLASITKQVTAALVVRRYSELKWSIDDPVDSWSYPEVAGLTMRQLLTHQTGLANPDDDLKDASGVPHAYADPANIDAHCESKPPRPGAPFSYNNCDYILAARAGLTQELPMSAVAGARSSNWTDPLPAARGMSLARPNEIGVPGFVGGKLEPRFQLASWGAAGGLMGTTKAVFAFDRSLMTGKLLPPAALADLWKPEGNGSYQALGAWVFPGKLAGCAAPKRIVQRDGEIYGVQARNFILPDDDLVVIVFTNRSADDFAIGEAWEGKGFAFDLLSAAVEC